MNSLPIEIVKYTINDYLILSDKLNLQSVNKRFQKMQKNIIWYHFGEILINKLGMTIETINKDMIFFKDYKLDFFNEMINICFRESDYYKKINNIYGLRIPFKNLLKINKSNLEECKKMILDNTLLQNKKYNSKPITSYYYNKYFYTSHALLF
ncbi:hypothetical protein CPAV1605_923 [seawater metagenome]|uniref:Uncharacterized protein n=1 Tax=seawater metagenome TaxID=1561972 RepID=A0A5E8CIJ4_9ZZZZ